MPKKYFDEYLYEEEFGGHRLWLVRGTEDMKRYPHHNFDSPLMGVPTFGTKKINGQTCLSIAKRDSERIKPLGWIEVHHGDTYAYMARASSKEEE